MIKYSKGTVFNANAQAMVNTINCTGVMGAGIALEFMLRYPKMFNEYKAQCAQQNIEIGKVSYFDDEQTTIVNFPTKWHFKYPSKLEWIEQGLNNFVSTYAQHDITSIAFPKLGTLNGGLEWMQVKILMEKYLSQINAEVIICLDELKEAEGLEKDMLSFFNTLSLAEIGNIVKLNAIQKNKIKSKSPLERFWHLSKIDGVGLLTYSKIFTFCYDAVKNKEKVFQQITMFD
ncbi:MAG: macro domain-containing protein [Clostridiales bacterium]|jgi:O-acetyl-ADP-ribose deacetylase (regulator of RNase III)|nr:macro domain-containing protein [Clostridiales bacterium]